MKNLFYTGPAFRILHTEYAKQSRIDTHASSQATDSVDINAPIEDVWSVIMDIEKWPSFNPAISDVRLESAVAVDAKGKFKLNGFPIAFTFAVVEANRELTWTGTALWTKAIDRLWLERLSSDATRLHLDESLAGAFVPLMSSSQQLHRQHAASLLCFKAAAVAFANR